jgi:O-antigen/teichoic acid export membrane protein
VAGLGGAVVVSSLVVLVVSWILSRRILPELRFSRRYVSRSRFRTLITFGGQFFFVRLMGTIYRQMDKAIVGIALGVSYVTFYEVANRIHQGASMVQSVASSSLLPATAYLRRHKAVLHDLYLRGTSYTLAAAVPVTVGAFILAEPLIRTWIGGSVTEAAGATRLFLVFLVFVAVHAVGTSMIIALGRMRFAITLMVVFTLVNLVASIALVGPLGVEGVILGTLIAQLVIWLPYTLYFLKTFEVSWGEWTRRIVLPNLPGLVLQAATAYPLFELAQGTSSLVVVGLLLLVSVALSVAAYLFVGLRREDRSQLLLALRSAVGRGGEDAPDEAAPTDADVPPGHYEAELEELAANSEAPPSPSSASP